MNKVLEWFFPRLFMMIQSGGRSSAMNPLLCLVVTTLFGMWLVPNDIYVCSLNVKGLLAVAFCLCLLVSFVAYFLLLHKNPRLLQSEKYQIAMRKMDMASQRLGAAPSYQEVDKTFETHAIPTEDARLVIENSTVNELTTEGKVIVVAEGAK